MWKYKFKRIWDKIALTIAIFSVAGCLQTYLWLCDNGYEEIAEQVPLVFALVGLAYLLTIRSDKQVEEDNRKEQMEKEAKNKK